MRTERQVLCLLVLGALLAAAAPARARPADGALDAEVRRVLSTDRRSAARVGVHVVAAASGRVLYSRRATEPFIPASNQKLLTAAVALQALGPDYEFRTELLAGGPIRAGRLEGNLIVRGGGDPTIGGRYDSEDAEAVFRRWAEALNRAGVHRVAGDLVADDTRFDRVWHHPHWSPEQAWKWYFAPACALSVNDNCVTVTVKPGGAAGEAAVVSLAPPTGTLEVANTCTTSATRHVIWFERRAGERRARVGGHVQLGSGGYSGRMTVPEPPLCAVETLKSVLEAEGISVAGRARVIRQGQRAAGPPLHVRRTPLLPVLLTMLKRSHNHYAEQVLKTVGAESYGLGSWSTGAHRAGRLLRELGFREGEFEVDDGSGLSRGNRLPPAGLTALLVEMRRSEHYAEFNSCLAVAGRDGTLDDRLTEAPYAGNVRGKTGYLDGVGALSGYATTRGGMEVAFSILVNDDENPPGTYSMRETVDPICRAIVDHAG